MSFTFTPQTEEEVSNLLKAGVYDFQVKNAEHTTSKKGNQMVKVTLSVWDENGVEKTINDYLMEAMMFKVKHFCDAIGLEDKYEQGKFHADDCIGKSGKCKIRIEEAGEYPAKNSVQDYVKGIKGAEKPAPSNSNSDFKDDDIPF